MITGVLAAKASSDYDELRASPLDPGSGTTPLEAERDRVRGLALATDVLLVSTLVVGAASLFLTVRGRTSSAPAARAASLHLDGVRLTF